MSIGKFGDFRDTENILHVMSSCFCIRQCTYENGFVDRCVSAIFEFSGNEFDY